MFPTALLQVMDELAPTDWNAQGRALFHGDGTNRWFGKPSLTAL
jgi:hypothetical protein